LIWKRIINCYIIWRKKVNFWSKKLISCKNKNLVMINIKNNLNYQDRKNNLKNKKIFQTIQKIQIKKIKKKKIF
jgi:hypothetical protein